MIPHCNTRREHLRCGVAIPDACGISIRICDISRFMATVSPLAPQRYTTLSTVGTPEAFTKSLIQNCDKPRDTRGVACCCGQGHSLQAGKAHGRGRREAGEAFTPVGQLTSGSML